MQLENGFDHELNFWKGFVKTDRFINGWLSNEKTPELHDETYEFFKSLGSPLVADLGSGVVSILHGTVEDYVAYDPLGDEYAKIFDYSKGTWAKPTAIAGEDLVGGEYYDVVHISNALDHCQNPEKVFENMVNASRKYVVIQGFVNEAQEMNYVGLHQWDLDLDNDTLTLNGKPLTNPKIKPFKWWRKKEIFRGKDWIIWIGKKI